MAKTITSPNIKLKNVRAAFVTLDTPDYFKPGQPGPNEKKKRRITFLLDPTNADHAKTIAEIKAAAKKVAEATWPDGIPKSLEKCYGTEEDLDKVYDGFKGMFWVRTARNEDKGPPAIVGRRKNPKTTKFDQLIIGQPEFPFGGCYVNGTINLWGLNNHGQKRIVSNVEAVQYVDKGEAFGSAPPDADAEFEPLADGPVDEVDGDDPFA